MNKLVTLSFLLFSQLYASSLLDLNLEDLTQIEATNTSASLTSTSSQDIPASVTIISQKEIEESGARNLDELLEIYVPSFAYMYKIYGSQMGMRGIISDRNNKILLLVNNRVMNIKTSDGGAVTERWFSMLGDIKQITVVTGSGSPIYGAGAIAGVINIETFNGSEKEGVEVSATVGGIENFAMAQVSYSTQVFDNTQLYMYYGIDKYNGSDVDDAPMKFAFDYNGPYFWNKNIVSKADEPYPYATTRDNSSVNQDFRHKAHFQLSNDNFLFWMRYTYSSLETPTEQKIFQWLTLKNQHSYEETGTENQQFTIFGEYKQRINSDILVSYDVSYQKSDLYTQYLNLENTFIQVHDKAWGEDNLVAKVQVNYQYNDKNIFAFGSEYDYNWFGRDTDIGSTKHFYVSKELYDKKWTADILSFFGEYQKHFTNNLTMFAGARADKHSFLRWTYSPRVSFIYNIDNEDIFKLNWSNSNRYSDEADLYLHHLDTVKYDDIESIETYEAIYIKYISNVKLEMSGFYSEHDVVAYDKNIGKTVKLGTVNSYGGEFQLNYQTDKLLWNLSHSYTKLRSLELINPHTTSQNISAQPYGYGSDFASWNNNITKLRCDYKVTSSLKWVNSLRVFWGISGGEDMANYNKSLNTPPGAYKAPYYDDGHTRAFEESVYYNSSLLWKINKNTTLSLYGYNLLGLFDKDLNKRNFYYYTSQYRDMAPSVAFNIKYKLQ